MSLFGQLLEHKWRDVGFPTAHFKLRLRHDLAKHEYPRTEGANVEWTGRAPIEFTARIPFLNNISPGPNESWALGATPLYPDTFRKWFDVMRKGDTGPLQHPEFGIVQCKVVSCEVDWEASTQDGVWVDAVWIETIDDVNAPEAFQSGSPISRALTSALALDSSITVTQALQFPTPFHAPSLSDMLQSIQGAIDQVGLAEQRAAGQIAAIEYRLDSIQDAVERTRNALNWTVRRDVEKMRSATHDIAATIGTANAKIGFWPVRKAATLANIATQIPAKLGDVMKLNIPLLAAPVVPEGSIVRYFA